jgi:ribosomal protein L32
MKHLKKCWNCGKVSRYWVGVKNNVCQHCGMDLDKEDKEYA